MPLPRFQRGKTRTRTRKPGCHPQETMRKHSPLLLVCVGLLLMALALAENARAAPPPPLSDVQWITATELRG